MIDNVFLKGSTYDPSAKDDRTAKVRGLLSKISTDDRVDASIAPVGDGIVLAPQAIRHFERWERDTDAHEIIVDP